ncbi:arylsulfatase [Marinobacter sp. NP-4(2019)]|uniref:arylsulfatase n=1 Tax=Marinobacter sp. NP-4(2019) TaxID=2488665 RepID=UPI000FC3DA48|nr:arylsulfatase [Marinobacter sp. NP-4(2019)]AZT82560.1 arylsulfatase [Marinobacter sp. NP-4(2019)]
MKTTFRQLLSTAALVVFSALSIPASGANASPNILLLVADDLGYSDIGAFGSEIATPHIDSLVSQGRMITDFYSAPSCSPTRAMLLTGNDQHLAGLGLMAEVRKRRFPGNVPVLPGYEGVLRHQVVTLAQLLNDAGYKTILSGKWHLGKSEDLQPQNQGFEQSWTVQEGGSANFKQDEMGLFPNYPATFLHNGEPLELPEDFNATEYYTDKLIASTEEARNEGRPFFALAAYTAPHWPLQAPDRYLEMYRGKYDEGYQAIADARIGRMRELGLLPEDFPERAVLDESPAWETLSAAEQQRSAREMEVYAAMVTQLDTEIGRLVEHLKRTGQYEDTFIMFMSDNGPESKDYDRRVGDWIAENFDNSLDNLGRKNSFVTYPKAWAQVSAQPFRGYKQTIQEGGIRVPAIIHYPAKLAPGGPNEVFMSVRDVMPTLLELASVNPPGIEYQGRSVYPVQGRSRWSALHDASVQDQEAGVLGWEVDGSAALRKGPLKLVYTVKEADTGWQLYDLAQDPGERNNLAEERPAELSRLLTEWQHYAQVNNIALNDDLTPALPLIETTSKAGTGQ